MTVFFQTFFGDLLFVFCASWHFVSCVRVIPTWTMNLLIEFELNEGLDIWFFSTCTAISCLLNWGIISSPFKLSQFVQPSALNLNEIKANESSVKHTERSGDDSTQKKLNVETLMRIGPRSSVSDGNCFIVLHFYLMKIQT